MNSNKTTNFLLIIVIALLLALLYFRKKENYNNRNHFQESLSTINQPINEVDSTPEANTDFYDEGICGPSIEKESEIMTNNNEETISIDQPKKSKDKPEKKVKEQPKVKIELVEVPKVSQNALFKGGKRNSGGAQQGTGEGGGLGDGKGTGNGPGTGSGDGGGNGGGSGKGDGFGYDLTGRGLRSSVKVINDSEETGVVVISITVDKNGNVISAVGPARGSTTTSPNLVKKSKEAAEKMKFSPSEVEVQKGTMTFRYFLK